MKNEINNAIVTTVFADGRIRVMSQGFFVQFPRSLRTRVGLMFMVEKLVLSSAGKHYRATGKIQEIKVKGSN